MTPPRTSTSWPKLAADDRAVYDGEAASGEVASGTLSSAGAAPAGAVRSAIAVLVEVPVTTLTDDQVREELAEVEHARRVLEARACRLTSALTSRAAARARERADGDPRAGERAARHVRAELADRYRLTPSQVKRAQQIGDRVDGSPAVANALDAGTITPDHVRAIDRTLEHLSGDQRRRAEAALVEVARTGSARDVNDAGIRLLSVMDHDAAVDAERRKHARRDGRITKGPDGIVRVNAQFSGLQGELAMTAFHAFRRPDAPGEHRTPGQRGADALADLFRAALGDREAGAGTAGAGTADGSSTLARPAGRAGGDAATTGTVTRAGPRRQHRVQPHIVVTVDLPTLLTGEGVAETEWTGPVPWGALRHILDQAGLTFVVLRDEVPIAVTEQTRYIPTGLWKALKLRDGGCIREHCDAPAAWCQVAHLADWFTDGGKLSLDTAGLLCTGDHRAFDDGRLAVTWLDGRPVVHPPGRGPADESRPAVRTRRGGRRPRGTDPPG